MSAASLAGIVEVGSNARGDGTEAMKEGPYEARWVAEPTGGANIDIRLRWAEREKRVKADQPKRRIATVTKTKALDGIITVETLRWLVENGQSLAPDELGEIIEAMAKPRRKRGPPLADERTLKYAFLIHREVERLSTNNERDYDVVGRAAAIVRCEVRSTRKVPGVKRLREIYRDEKTVVEQRWADFKAFVLAE